MKITLRNMLAVCLMAPLAVFAQALPNGDMESWEPLLLGGGEKPVGWDTPDVIAGVLLITDRVVEKDAASVHSGSFAARLTTKDLEAPAPIGTLTVPGTLALGTIIFDPLTLETGVVGGLAMSEAPDAVIGYYTYAPASGDTMNVTVVALKAGETIGAGEFRTSSSVASYTMFEAPITYFVSETPDTIQVIITSSGGFASATAGSVAHIDALAFTGISATEDLTAAGLGVTIFPNPTTDFIHVLNPSGNAATVELFNLNGQRTDVFQVNGGTTALDVRHLSAGMYLMRMSQNGQLMYSGKFRVTQ